MSTNLTIKLDINEKHAFALSRALSLFPPPIHNEWALCAFKYLLGTATTIINSILEPIDIVIIILVVYGFNQCIICNY